MSNQVATCLAFASCWLLACHMVFIGERPAETGTTSADSETVTITPEISTTPGLHSSGGQTSGSGTSALETSIGFPDTSSSTESSAEVSSTTAELASTTESASKVDLPESDCGNNNLDAGEYCDNGGEDSPLCDDDCTEVTCEDDHLNGTAGETCLSKEPGCRSDCTKCGDGILNGPEGVEQCEIAMNNCDDNCKVKCGNKKVDIGEQCDVATDEQAEGFCNEKCQHSGLFAFVTSASSNGYLIGLDGADNLCRTAALALHPQEPSRAMNYHAWISYANNIENTSPQSEGRMVHCGKSYYSSDGKRLIATTFESLTSEGPETAIELDETGLIATGRVWTNTVKSGAFKSVTRDCLDWSNAAAQVEGQTGEIGIGDTWTEAGPQKCSALARLYCFEQAPAGCL